jgi:hypothetical protein
MGVWCVGFQVLTAVVMKSPTFWDITLCSPLEVSLWTAQHYTPEGRTVWGVVWLLYQVK